MKAHVDVYKHWMLNFFRSCVLLRSKTMTESVYFSTQRLTRSKAVSGTNDLGLSSQNSNQESVKSSYFGKLEETKVSRKRPSPNIKVEEDTTYQSLQTNNGHSVKTEEVKLENSVCDQELNNTSVKKEKWEPPDWRKQLENINEMRKNRGAPVDTMGCDVISDVLASPQVHL